MELEFIICMACIVLVGSLFLFLVYTNETRKCNCCHFFTQERHKYFGKCKLKGEPQLRWDSCKYWKQKEKKQ